MLFSSSSFFRLHRLLLRDFCIQVRSSGHPKQASQSANDSWSKLFILLPPPPFGCCVNTFTRLFLFFSVCSVFVLCASCHPCYFFLPFFKAVPPISSTPDVFLACFFLLMSHVKHMKAMPKKSDAVPFLQHLTPCIGRKGFMYACCWHTHTLTSTLARCHVHDPLLSSHSHV